MGEHTLLDKDVRYGSVKKAMRDGVDLFKQQVPVRTNTTSESMLPNLLDQDFLTAELLLAGGQLPRATSMVYYQLSPYCNCIRSIWQLYWPSPITSQRCKSIR